MFPSVRASDETEFRPAISGLDEIDDLCLAAPLEIGGRMMGGAVLSVAVTGLSYLVDPEQPTQGVRELFVADDVVVGRGDIDTEQAVARLTAGTESAFGDIPFERVGEEDDFTLYRSTVDDTVVVAAIREDAILVANTRDEIRTVIETERGDHERATERMDTFEWLVETAGTGQFVAGWLSPANLSEYYFGDVENRPGADLITQQDDFCASVSFSVEDSEITTDLALHDSGLDAEKRDRLDSRLGTASEKRDISFDGERVSVTGTYDTDVLDIEFTEPGDDGSGSGSDDIASEAPPEVEEAVPDGAFSFSYDEKRERVRVEFVEAFEAERVTIQSIEADSEFSSPDPSAINYAYVFVDPDGDEVVVTVTVDGESGPVARTEIP
jgi:hypothetical protein